MLTFELVGMLLLTFFFGAMIGGPHGTRR